ncbi:MAG: 7-cyano-7-deazaguanine synthase QueC [Bacteroidota bacterium]|jgi:7-cyano-7-deazaguanine synthase
MSKTRAVVLVSGGMDSCVTAAIANLQHELAFLHVNYGQRTEQRELKAFYALAKHYGVRQRLIADLTHLKSIGGSSLTDLHMEVTEANPETLFHSKKNDIPTSYVPFRNANILSAAVSWAEVVGAEHIFIGAVEEDSSGYPDCRKEFYDAFNIVIDLGTKPETKISINTPVINLKKSEIVRRGMELNAPFELTWSCYTNEDRACGVCDSCALRLRAFQIAGIEDPIQYAQRPRYIS